MGTLFAPARKDRMYTNEKEEASCLCKRESMNVGAEAEMDLTCIWHVQRAIGLSRTQDSHVE